jgi:hypothetical protein
LPAFALRRLLIMLLTEIRAGRDGAMGERPIEGITVAGVVGFMDVMSVNGVKAVAKGLSLTGVRGV